jgi:hypothetical protein
LGAGGSYGIPSKETQNQKGVKEKMALNLKYVNITLPILLSSMMLIFSGNVVSSTETKETT